MSEPIYSYQYPRAAITTDSVVFGYDDEQLHILLIERKGAPFQGTWALPGGFLDLTLNETLEQCAARELMEETCTNIAMEQFHAFSAPNRDPRGRVITIAFLALVRKGDLHAKARSDAKKAEWFALNRLPQLAFDHEEIITKARACLKEKLRTGTAAKHSFSIDEVKTILNCLG